MAGITGLGTTYNLPNYTGILYQLSRSETPFFSAIGGLSGGRQTTETAFEWQTFDLRDAAQPAGIVEGADAPTAQARVRANVSNVVQIHQEAVSIAYSKLAAIGLKSGVNNEQANPVRNELDWQVEVMLRQMVRDIEVSFLNGTYQAPSDNSTGRKTRGLLTAATTNAMDVKATAALPTVTATAATDLVNSAAHGLEVGDSVVFTELTGGAGLVVDTPYYVVSKAAGTFKVSTVKGGTAVNITTDATAATAYKLTPLTVTHVEDLLQRIYEAGGMDETSTIIANASQKKALSAVYGAAYAKANPVQGNVGGVAVSVLETDFGRLNIMLNPHMPKHKLAVAQLGQCSPVYLEVPGKGHFFAEPLAKTGASDKVMLYGEVGLAYGNEKAHGLLTGLAL